MCLLACSSLTTLAIGIYSYFKAMFSSSKMTRSKDEKAKQDQTGQKLKRSNDRNVKRSKDKNKTTDRKIKGRTRQNIKRWKRSKRSNDQNVKLSKCQVEIDIKSKSLSSSWSSCSSWSPSFSSSSSLSSSSSGSSL